MNRTFILFLLLLFFINIFLAVIYYQGKYQGKKIFPIINNQEEDESTSIEASKITLFPTSGPTPTNSPKKIPHGKIGFTVGVKNNPVMRIGFLDPYDPEIGQKQTVSITVKNPSPVDSVNAAIQTDKETKQFPLKLVEGTALDGRWEATWEIKDTYLYTYILVLDAVSGVDTSKAIVTLR